MIGGRCWRALSGIRQLPFRLPIAGQRGVVLVAVLWICALIMWCALQIAAETRMQGEEQIHSIRKAQALYLATGGCYEALARAGLPPPLRLDAPSDQNWQPDGKPRVVQYDTGIAVVIIESEDLKVNVNKTGPLQLKQLLQKAGAEEAASETIADFILDFIDQDDTPRMHGGEKDWYRAHGLNYDPFNGALSSLDQLMLVPGVTDQLYYGYGRGGEATTAEEAEIYKNFLIPGKYSLFSMLTVYGQNTNLPRNFNDEQTDAPPVVWKQGGIYRILSFGRSANGPPAVGVWLTVRLSPDGQLPYKILSRKVL